MKKVWLLLLNLVTLSLNAAAYTKAKYQFPTLEYLKYSELICELNENYFFEKTELLEQIAEKRFSQKKLEKIVDKAIETYCKKYSISTLPFNIEITWKNKRVQLINTLIQCSTFLYRSPSKDRLDDLIPLYE
jgi:hypothetical protein